MSILRIILFLNDAVRGFLHKNCQYLAAAISFYALFSIFPLSLALISVLGFLIGPQIDQGEFVKNIADIIPISGDLISKNLEGILDTRTITGIVSFLGLVWASSAVFGAIRKGVNTAWGITVPRPFLKERMIDIGLVFGAGLLILIILFTAPIIEVIQEIVKAVSPKQELPINTFWVVLSNLVSPILIFFSILSIYKWLPNTKINTLYIIPGALLSSICLILAQMLFIWYVTTFSPYNIIYGSVGVLIALLVWVYLSALILLFGAQLSSSFHTYANNGTRKKGLHLWLGFRNVRVKVLPIHIK